MAKKITMNVNITDKILNDALRFSRGRKTDRITNQLSWFTQTHRDCIGSVICSERNTHTTVSRPFVPDYPGEPVPEETFTHSHPSWSSDILYQLPPSTTIHVQFTCLTVLFHNLSPGPLWSSSWTEKPAKKLTDNCCAFRSITCTEQWEASESKQLTDNKVQHLTTTTKLHNLHAIMSQQCLLLISKR